MKVLIGFFFLILSCTPCHYVVEERQFGVEEAPPYDDKDILKVDTLYNEFGGAVKVCAIKLKVRR